MPNNIDTINFPVPPYYADVTKAQISTAKSFVGQDFTNMALNANYILGNGNQKLPITYVGEALSNITYFYEIKDYVQPNTNERYWLFGFGGAGSTVAVGSASLNITSSLYNIILENKINIITGSNTVLFAESLNMTSSSYDIDEISIQVSLSGANATVFETIELFDAPRTFINPTTQTSEFAIDVISNNVGKPIFTTPSDHNSSYSGIVNASIRYHDSIKSGKGLWSYMRSYKSSVANPNYGSGNKLYANSTAHKNAFTDGLLSAKPIIFATQEDRTSTSRVCTIWAFGAVETVGDSGVIAFSSSLASTSLTFTSQTPSWQSTTLTLETESVTNPNYGGFPYLPTSFAGNFDINLWKPIHTAGVFNVWTVQVFEL